MILEQFYLACLAHASYLVADERTRTAVVIDPRRDVDEYLARAEALGVRIEHVLLTHFHADFVAGHLELRDRVGAQIHLGARAEAEYAFHALAEGDALELGDVRLEVLETPGHTPEGISIVAFDLATGTDVPHAVFTGDTLFVGDVGRPDLMASVGITAEELAGMLYDSLHDKLLKLPDETLVYPAHGAGSMCGKNLGSETFSTIGTQRKLNYALQPMSREEFIGVVSASQPTAPAYFGFDAALNKRERETLDHSLDRAVKPLALDALLARRDAGAVVLDVRDKDAFAARHLAGSLNVGLDGKFATWAGALVPHEREIVLITPPGEEHQAALRLGRIGFDRVVGFLEGGIEALAGRDELVSSTTRLTAGEVAERLRDDAPLTVVDIRGPGEYEDGHVEGSLSVPLPALGARLDELPRDRPFAVVCRSGYRSSAAVSLLAAEGFTNQLDLDGGMDAWEAAGLPVSAPVGGGCSA